MIEEAGNLNSSLGYKNYNFDVIEVRSSPKALNTHVIAIKKSKSHAKTEY